ncbi:MAG: sensor histidine kinase [Rhodospirillales bacterium]|nr:sensor histidine kinase [Rhodospirillales bacterium]
MKSCEYLLALIDDVLDLARIDSGRPGLSIEAIDPATALPRYLETIRGMAGEYNVVVDDQISGANVPKGLQAKLFDPFERLGKEASEISSTGIGLTVAKDLTDMMDINLPGMAGLRRQRTSRRTRIPGTFRSSPSPPPPCLPK